jgi:hypothetical protein
MRKSLHSGQFLCLLHILEVKGSNIGSETGFLIQFLVVLLIQENPGLVP